LYFDIRACDIHPNDIWLEADSPQTWREREREEEKVEMKEEKEEVSLYRWVSYSLFNN
jgi:hypothetical protein